MSGQTYGMVGWEEFSSNRLDILDKVKQAKIKSSSRRVKVEHGNVAEAAVREWLESFLPRKYAVTSGYIIPNFVEMGDPYYLGHFDVIIYDSLESPVLWIDENDDKSELGKSRAIPAQHVFCVLEVKSSLTVKTSSDVIKKLSELNSLACFFPEYFCCGAVFVDLDEKNINKGSILNNLNADVLPVGFFGGLVLHTKVDQNLVGYIDFYDSTARQEDFSNAPRKPLVVAGNKMEVYEGIPSGTIYVGRGFSAKATAPHKGAGFHFNRTYSAYSVSAKRCLFIQWSTANFVTFSIDLLGRFEGVVPMSGEKSKYIFGQVFDKLSKKEDSMFPDDDSFLAIKKPRENA